MKIPFDSFVLETVVADCQPFVGGKVQDIRQPSEHEIALELYAGGKIGMILLSCDPVFFRAHFITRRPATTTPPPQFLSALRSRIAGAGVSAIRQIQGDRVMEIAFANDHVLVAELMGKHSNVILVGPDKKVFAAAKWVGRGKSSRPILPGVHYERPPVMKPGVAPRSRFLEDLVAAGGSLNPIAPVLSPGHGAYPVSVATLGLPEFPRESISIALEQHFAQAIPAAESDSLRRSLLAQLDRVLLAREAALSDLAQALEAGNRAGRMQRLGELILAYGGSIDPGAAELRAWDYDGAEVDIKLDPELDFKENANHYFEKAKKAKARLGTVRDQIERLSSDAREAGYLRERIASEERLERLRELRDEARKHRWLTEQTVAATKEERPFEGHRVRELMGPGGFRVLFGENAEANDYLTLRVAKPNDWWLHIRGSVSAHVVIQTGNHPEKVQRDTLLFAAKVAVQHSPSKHAGYVPVDYTLKRYVRKPKGAPKGTALYTHEKTLHVEG